MSRQDRTRILLAGLAAGAILSLTLLVIVSLVPGRDGPLQVAPKVESGRAEVASGDGVSDVHEGEVHRHVADQFARLMVENVLGLRLGRAWVESQAGRLECVDGVCDVPVSPRPEAVVVRCSGYEDFKVDVAGMSATRQQTVVLQQQPGLFFMISAKSEVGVLWLAVDSRATGPGFSEAGPMVASAVPITSESDVFVGCRAATLLGFARGDRGSWSSTLTVPLQAVSDHDRTVVIELLPKAMVRGSLDPSMVPEIDRAEVKVVLCGAVSPPVLLDAVTPQYSSDVHLMSRMHALEPDAAWNFRGNGLLSGDYWIYAVSRCGRISWPLRVRLADGQDVLVPRIALDTGRSLTITPRGFPASVAAMVSVVIGSESEQALLGMGVKCRFVDGAWRMSGLASGQYRLSYDVDGLRSQASRNGELNRVWVAVGGVVRSLLREYAMYHVDLTKESSVAVELDLGRAIDGYREVFLQGGRDYYRALWMQAIRARNRNRAFFVNLGLSEEAARVAFLEDAWQALHSSVQRSSLPASDKAGIESLLGERHIALVTEALLRAQ